MINEATKINKLLAKGGVFVEDIYDLVNTSKDYKNIIPILIELLKQGISDEKLKEGVIRSLAVKGAGTIAGEILIEEYKKTPQEKMMLKWVIGNTIEVIISVNILQDVLKIVKNKENGMSRERFIAALGKMKSKDVEQTLIDLLDDETIAGHAIYALRKLNSEKARNKIQTLEKHKKFLIRKEAKIYLKKRGKNEV